MSFVSAPHANKNNGNKREMTDSHSQRTPLTSDRGPSSFSKPSRSQCSQFALPSIKASYTISQDHTSGVGTQNSKLLSKLGTKGNSSLHIKEIVPGYRKRKQKTTEDQAGPENEAKRVKSPSAQSESMLIKTYYQNEQRLLEFVKQLHDPKKSNTMSTLRDANDCIKLMAQTRKAIMDD